jgi:glutamine amidotransferase
MIGIIDYGVGNIKAFENVYKKLDIPIKIVKTEQDFVDVTKIILPGVGAFDHAMEKLNQSGMRSKLDELVSIKKLPIIGICVGMQMMAKSSDEGNLPGLSWIDANVKKFDVSKINSATRLPHMGWNDVEVIQSNRLFDGLENNAKFYFLHSYYFDCFNPEDGIAQAEYGVPFICAANHQNIYGVQFHPEKSHDYGVKLLENFSKL